MLEDQRIAEIQTVQVSSSYPRQVGSNSRRGIHGTGPTSRAYRIRTDQGASGWGLARSRELEPVRLLGRALSKLFDPAVGVAAPEAVPLDLALHDLTGHILGQPVWQLLGAQGPRSIPAYDGAIYMDDLLPEDRPRGVPVILDECRQDWALGYRAFKLKIGRGYQWMSPEEGLARDIEVTRRVRAAYPQADILVDGNDGFSCEQFLRYLDAVADCNLYWIDPL